MMQVCVVLEQFLESGGGIHAPCALVGVEEKLVTVQVPLTGIPTGGRLVLF
jgi:hypothetical protein